MDVFDVFGLVSISLSYVVPYADACAARPYQNAVSYLMRAIFVESRRVANRVFPYSEHQSGKKYLVITQSLPFLHIYCSSLTITCKIIRLSKYLIVRQVLRQIEAIASFVDLCSNMALVMLCILLRMTQFGERRLSVTITSLVKLLSLWFISIILFISLNIGIVHRVPNRSIASECACWSFSTIIVHQSFDKKGMLLNVCYILWSVFCKRPLPLRFNPTARCQFLVVILCISLNILKTYKQIWF